MLYRVRIDLAFEGELEANTFFNAAKRLMTRAVKITHPDGTIEATSIEVHRCYHDEDPTKPCEIIKRIEV